MISSHDYLSKWRTMGAMKQVDRQATSQEIIRNTNQLTLYEQYGSMAYGVILQIIPEPELAQNVLIDLFTSPQIKACAEVPARAAGEIIRLARAKALATKPVSTTSLGSTTVSDTNDSIEKLVFDLSFRQGYTLEAIAEKLQLSRANVLKSIYTYFKNFRLS